MARNVQSCFANPQYARQDTREWCEREVVRTNVIFCCAQWQRPAAAEEALTKPSAVDALVMVEQPLRSGGGHNFQRWAETADTKITIW